MKENRTQFTILPNFVNQKKSTEIKFNPAPLSFSDREKDRVSL